MKVDFLIAGVQKGATSALHHFLRQHPDIYLPEKKELHFFDNEQIDWDDPSHENIYHAYYNDAPEGSLCGEATPIYTYWQPSVARIHRYNPKIKLIVSLRDPVARAYSHWRMEVARNTETLPFSQAIREGRDRVNNEAEIPGQHRVYSYVERGFYAEQIYSLMNFFDRRQLLFLTTYELFNQRKETLDRICTFLEVSRFINYPDHQFVFSHKDMELSLPDQHDVDYLRSMFQDDFERAQVLVDRKIEREII